MKKQNEGALPNEAGQGLTIQLVPEALVIGRVNLPTADGTDRLQVELYKRAGSGWPRGGNSGRK